MDFMGSLRREENVGEMWSVLLIPVKSHPRNFQSSISEMSDTWTSNLAYFWDEMLWLLAKWVLCKWEPVILESLFICDLKDRHSKYRNWFFPILEQWENRGPLVSAVSCWSQLVRTLMWNAEQIVVKFGRGAETAGIRWRRVSWSREVHRIVIYGIHIKFYIL